MRNRMTCTRRRVRFTNARTSGDGARAQRLAPLKSTYAFGTRLAKGPPFNSSPVRMSLPVKMIRNMRSSHATGV